MKTWSEQLGLEHIHDFALLQQEQKQKLLSYLNDKFPVPAFEYQLQQRHCALENLSHNRDILSGVEQLYPECIQGQTQCFAASDLSGYAVMLTAGGEGERLRQSLEAQGVAQEHLINFTKATFPLPEFYSDFGTLHINMSLLSALCKKYSLRIPVIITTGPEGSTTARLIPEICKRYNNFGLPHVRIIPQDERLHFTTDNTIAYTLINDVPYPLSHPDETGGPIMQLKKKNTAGTESTLHWLGSHRVTKILLLQATAVYDPDLLLIMASTGKNYDGVGIGIERETFPQDDPYGTYVVIKHNTSKKLIIVEQEVRNDITRSLTNPQGTSFLPFNTGLYVFDTDLIMNNDLPDYATPPKIVLPQLARSPKVGYAATDILSFAKKPAVLTIAPHSYGVLKNAADLEKLSLLAKSFKLNLLCEKTDSYLSNKR